MNFEEIIFLVLFFFPIIWLMLFFYIWITEPNEIGRVTWGEYKKRYMNPPDGKNKVLHNTEKILFLLSQSPVMYPIRGFLIAVICIVIYINF